MGAAAEARPGVRAVTVVEDKPRVLAQHDRLLPNTSAFDVVIGKTGFSVLYNGSTLAAFSAEKMSLAIVKSRKSSLVAYLERLVSRYGLKVNGLPNIELSHAITRFVESDKKKKRQKLERALAEDKQGLRDDNSPPAIALYQNREDKSEKAVEYLLRLYGNDTDAGTLTLSDLRMKDASLWRALRNWAHAGGHELDAIIPRGKTTPGRARKPLGFDPSSLDPSDPIQAAAIELANTREAARQRARTSRQKLQPK